VSFAFSVSTCAFTHIQKNQNLIFIVDLGSDYESGDSEEEESEEEVGEDGVVRRVKRKKKRGEAHTDQVWLSSAH
jgi:hypothetical protein